MTTDNGCATARLTSRNPGVIQISVALISACCGGYPRRSMQNDKSTSVDIIRFEPRYAEDFKRLNLEWLEKHFRVEPIDAKVLERPEDLIMGGGVIFLARSGTQIIGTQIVGTCALIHEHDGRYEVSKMSVTDGYKGLGIGRRLLLAAIEEFKTLRGRELFLETNKILRPAIALYESAGFAHTPYPAPSPYARSDVYMVYRG